ncbi:hypothetical protein C8Q80DRAFT_1161231 [Daedaleopsis nitida]|nr:hypothetical protein C8Q80DRAFT_1161231 [Daedaleopsis nitida]
MKSLSASIITAALLVVGVSAQDFTINTPNPPTQCVPTQFHWTGGTCELFLYSENTQNISPGGVPGATAFQQYTGLTGTSFTWSTNLTAGTSFGLTLTDANGQVAQSAPVSVQSGPDSSCLNGQASASTGDSTTAASTGTTAAATTSPATGATTSAGTGTTSKAAGSTSGTSTGTSSSSGSTATGGAGGNGAFSNTVSVGLVGVLSAVAAALLA